LVRGTLVETHGIRKGNFKQIVIAGRDLFENPSQQTAFGWSELIHGRHVTFTEYQGFEGPHSPVGNNYGKCLILTDKAVRPFRLDLEIIT
jgi:hypothetical protein